MPKSNLLPSLLVAALLCVSIASCLMAVRYYFSIKQVHKLQVQNEKMTRAVAVMRSLSAQCVQYSQRNPAINPLLTRLKLIPTNAVVTPTSPTATPATPGTTIDTSIPNIPPIPNP